MGCPIHQGLVPGPTVRDVHRRGEPRDAGSGTLHFLERAETFFADDVRPTVRPEGRRGDAFFFLAADDPVRLVLGRTTGAGGMPHGHVI